MRLLITGASGFIGTNLMDRLLEMGVPAVNLDKAEPKKDAHRRHWRECDILDGARLRALFADFQPTHVIHLAARTDILGKTVEDYAENTVGSANVLESIRNTPQVERAIITSSQYVNQYNGTPRHDEDYAAHTVYGESKIVMEQLTRSAGLRCVWTIIRPTNIWGPWHPRYPFEFWRTVARGLYLHPGRGTVIRSYGYVGNVVHQILRIFEAPPELVNGRVFYAGDGPVNLHEWVNGFSKAQIGRDVRVVPRPVVRTLAWLGDGLGTLGVGFPITSSRYRNMMSGNGAPMEPTFAVCGPSPFSLQEGIRETVAWMREFHPELVRVS